MSGSTAKSPQRLITGKVTSESGSGPECVGSAQRIDVVGGLIDIADIYRRSRTDIAGPQIAELSSIYELHVHVTLLFISCKPQSGAHALIIRAAI